ncbi:hypothetical protein GP486_003623 [Trichoglossum hirsutum]|uniref:Uncharacterized protein n=1 Tax=Trichoglossum hirsutum TaxID=265104 RepID=A0A9P8RQF0_9PEZI|nr:hypothetical protein GP486_003623 [Trichoglossum hirsutum]
MSVQNPTYLLSPSWTFRPDGPILLGNIIVDPFRPHRVLKKPDPAKPLPERITSTEKNWRLAAEKASHISVSVWAQFLENVHLKLGANRETAKSGKFVMESLDTVYLKDEPSIEDIDELVKDPKLQKFMRLDSLLCSPVYMVTGLKIAKGFQFTQTDTVKQGATAEASGSVTPSASVGGSIDASTETSSSSGFESANDIVFAYQLLRIKPKGWRKKTLQVSEFQPKAAFLSDKDNSEDEPVVVEKDLVSAADLIELQNGIELQDEKRKLVYVSLQED